MAKLKRALPLLLAVLLLAVLFCAMPRFAPSEITLEELQASEAFQDAVDELAIPRLDITWGEPVSYYKYLPGVGEVVCVPYLVCDTPDVYPLHTQEWRFFTGVLLWDADKEAPCSVPRLARRDIQITASPGPNLHIHRPTGNTDSPDFIRVSVTEERHLVYRDASTGSERAAAETPVCLSVQALTRDSDGVPNAQHDLPLELSFTLYQRSLLPTRSYTVSMSATSPYRVNVHR